MDLSSLAREYACREEHSTRNAFLKEAAETQVSSVWFAILQRETTSVSFATQDPQPLSYFVLGIRKEGVQILYTLGVLLEHEIFLLAVYAELFTELFVVNYLRELNFETE